MWAAKYRGDGTCVPDWRSVPLPTLEKPTDAIIRVKKTTIWSDTPHKLLIRITTPAVFFLTCTPAPILSDN